MSTFNGWPVVTMPSSPAPATMEFTGQDVVAVVPSVFTGQVQVQNWRASWLEAVIQMPPMRDATARGWIAWLLSTQGMAACFMMGDPLGQKPIGSGAGAITVSGAGQTGYSLQVLGGSGPSCLLPGDYLQVGFRLYRNLGTYNGGSATLTIWPQIRESPPDTTPVVVTNTQGMFRLKANERKWSLTGTRLTGLQFEVREAI
jgi:hypothetical protein